MAKRAPESEEYVAAVAAAVEARGMVAAQVFELVRDRDRTGSRGELGMRLQQVLSAEKRIAEAMGRHAQALELGLPLAPSVEDEAESRVLLRQAAMELAVAAASWAVAMDLEVRARRGHNNIRNGGGSYGTSR